MYQEYDNISIIYVSICVMNNSKMKTLNIILDGSKKPNNSGINLTKYMQEPLYLKLIALLKRKKKTFQRKSKLSCIFKEIVFIAFLECHK